MRRGMEEKEGEDGGVEASLSGGGVDKLDASSERLSLLEGLRSNKSETVECVLDRCPVHLLNNREGKTGWTPLIYAVYYRSCARICRLLLLAGADPNIADPGGLTATHWSAYFGPAETCRLLLEHGGDVSKRNAKGATPLMLAAKAGRTDVIQCLLEKGAGETIEARDVANRTALSLAVCGDHVGAVELLLAAGAGFVVPERPKDPSAGLTLRVLQAAQRTYLLRKLRFIHRAGGKGLVPRLLQRGDDKDAGPDDRPCILCLNTREEEQPVAAAVLNYVVTEMCSELFVELLGLL